MEGPILSGITSHYEDGHSALDDILSPLCDMTEIEGMHILGYDRKGSDINSYVGCDNKLEGMPIPLWDMVSMEE